MEKRKYWRIGVVLGAMILAGCAISDAPGERVETLPQGLTVLGVDDSSVSLAFRKADTVIFMEALRGHKTPAEYHVNPDFPLYEVDVRFVAEDGRYFWLQKGGDDFVDPVWETDYLNQDNLPPPTVSHELVIQMAAEAAAELEAKVAAEFDAALLETVRPLVDAIRVAGSNAPQAVAESKARLLTDPEVQNLPPGAELVYGEKGGDESPSLYYGLAYYYMDLHQKSICEWWNLCLIGHHSATRLFKWNGSAWAMVVDMCNHGTCASQMGWVCRPTGSYLHKAFNLQTCRTSYHATSNSGHNCHDDSRVQMANFAESRNNDGYQQWCNNGDHSTDISAGPGDQGGYPNCSATDKYKGYGYPGYTAPSGSGPCAADNACGGYSSSGGCYCDASCVSYGDCCSDGPC